MSADRLYEIIRRPVISEKSTMLAETNQILFETAIDATKKDIREAVEKIFKVKVKAVNTMRVKGKVKRFRGHPGRRRMRKKAIITLVEGQSLDISGGAA